MFKKILLPIDLEDPSFSSKALSVAIAQCQLHEAELHVLTVLPGYSMPMVASFFPADTMEKAKGTIQTNLEKLIADRIPKDVTVEAHVAIGTPYKEILACRRRLKADLIVLQSHNARFDHVLGSVAAKVVEQAKVSVMVIRGSETD